MSGKAASAGVPTSPLYIEPVDVETVVVTAFNALWVVVLSDGREDAAAVQRPSVSAANCLQNSAEVGALAMQARKPNHRRFPRGSLKKTNSKISLHSPHRVF